MRTLLAVLGVVGLVIIIVGAVNHAIGVRIDYLVGTASSVSLFWFAVAVAVVIVAAGALGAAGRGAPPPPTTGASSRPSSRTRTGGSARPKPPLGPPWS